MLDECVKKKKIEQKVLYIKHKLSFNKKTKEKRTDIRFSLKQMMKVKNQKVRKKRGRGGMAACSVLAGAGACGDFSTLRGGAVSTGRILSVLILRCSSCGQAQGLQWS